jgi:hypothetical protein
MIPSSRQDENPRDQRTHRLAFSSMVTLRRIEIFGEFIEFVLTKSSAWLSDNEYQPKDVEREGAPDEPAIIMT